MEYIIENKLTNIKTDQEDNWNEFNKKMIFYLVWLMVGIITPYVEYLVMYVVILWPYWAMGVLAIVPLVLLMAINIYNKMLTAKQKEIPYYYAKTILCVALGAILNTIRMHLMYNTFDTEFLNYTTAGSLCMLASMSIIQYFCIRMEKRKAYLGAVFLGTMTAYIICIVICQNYLKIIITFIMLAVAIFIMMQERKFCNQISEKQNISKRDFTKSIIRITLLTIVLLIPSFVWMCGIFIYFNSAACH